jgi:hypothetical protein
MTYYICIDFAFSITSLGTADIHIMTALLYNGVGARVGCTVGA